MSGFNVLMKLQDEVTRGILRRRRLFAVIINGHLLIRVGKFSTKFFMYMLKTNREFLSCRVIGVCGDGDIKRGVETHIGKERSSVHRRFDAIVEGKLG